MRQILEVTEKVWNVTEIENGQRRETNEPGSPSGGPSGQVPQMQIQGKEKPKCRRDVVPVGGEMKRNRPTQIAPDSADDLGQTEKNEGQDNIAVKKACFLVAPDMDKGIPACQKKNSIGHTLYEGKKM
jgi:hypothetical protein